MKEASLIIFAIMMFIGAVLSTVQFIHRERDMRRIHREMAKAGEKKK